MQRLNEEHNEGAEKKACNKHREESSIIRTQDKLGNKNGESRGIQDSPI